MHRYHWAILPPFQLLQPFHPISFYSTDSCLRGCKIPSPLNSVRMTRSTQHFSPAEILKWDVYSPELRCVTFWSDTLWGGKFIGNYTKLDKMNVHFAECVTANYVYDRSSHVVSSEFCKFKVSNVRSPGGDVGSVWGNQLMNWRIDEMYRCCIKRKELQIY